MFVDRVVVTLIHLRHDLPHAVLGLIAEIRHATGTAPSFSPYWSRQQTSPRPLAWGFALERVTRIELAL